MSVVDAVEVDTHWVDKFETVLFEDEGWSISRDTRMVSTKIFVCHNECTGSADANYKTDRNGWMAWFDDESPAICYHCKMGVPEGIQGLLYLMTRF